MSTHRTKPAPSPSNYFYAALAIVMLVFWMSFIPDWLTFVHVWKVEFFASVSLLVTLVLAYRHSPNIDLSSIFSSDEIRWVALPMTAFIIVSGASAFWANSWKSALHHTLVWTLYLIFYGVVRFALNQKGQYKKFLYVFSGSLLLCALPAIAGLTAFLVFGGANTLGIRFSRFGEQVVVLLPLILVAVVGMRGRSFLIGLAAISALWLMIFCSMSRAGMLVFTAATLMTGSLIFFIARFRRYRLRFAAILCGLIISPVILQSFSFLSAEIGSPPVSRFSDEASLSNSNDFRKLMASLSLEMFIENPVLGVGADNFGFEAQRYRETYAAVNGADPHLAQAESDIPERAHNEYLQIVAELGIVGAAIFAWFLAGIGSMAFRAVKGIRKLPPHAPAAVIGLLMFLASALVTSYSFRLIQNGFVFFFVLAVASRLLLKDKRTDTLEAPTERCPINAKLVLAPAIVACALLLVYCSLRVSSVILTEKANHTVDLDRAEDLYLLASRIDDENPFAKNHHGTRLYREQRFADSVPHLAHAIEIGLATSDSFSYLATAQTLSGDSAGAEATMAKAAKLYPRSVFVLVRYGLLQRENGKLADSAVTLERAGQINARAARTWQTMITQGFRIASSKEVADRDGLVSVMDLQPQSGIYAVLSERLIKYPEEQRFSLFRAVNAKPAATDPSIQVEK